MVCPDIRIRWHGSDGTDRRELAAHRNRKPAALFDLHLFLSGSRCENLWPEPSGKRYNAQSGNAQGKAFLFDLIIESRR